MKRPLPLLLVCALRVHLIADSATLTNQRSIGISATRSLRIGYLISGSISCSARTSTHNFGLLQFIIEGGAERYIAWGIN